MHATSFGLRLPFPKCRAVLTTGARVTAAVLVAFSASAQSTETSSEGTLPPELLEVPAGTVVKLPAPPESSPAEMEERWERARKRAAESSASATSDAELVVPYAGGPLPPEALSPQPGTVVKLLYVPASSMNAETAAVPETASASVANALVIDYDGGPVPTELLSPPEDRVVLIRAPSVPLDEDAVSDALAAVADSDAQPEIVVSTPPEADEIPPGTRVLVLEPEPSDSTDVKPRD